ncbi:hypothetical protein LVB77_10155 [Lysobacter sp. 5GHs7-4]|uniref:hypothetical protein n=1 Tax=Lysobacter sp. 5GHs7-4 TaxID=2904253 RepID=UPI001E3E5AE0|nr:hypothetical protein [Lysobacter sp. 5GHs7-4]UHQ25004.1 hypothetical protein LVB77_10155 [Lysobacter sp. 5GHs7-4]
MTKQWRSACVLAMGMAFSPLAAWAQDKAAVLIYDESAATVSGARMLTGFERLPEPGEKPVWTDGSRLDDIGVNLLAGGGLIGAGIADARAQEQRNTSIAALRTAMTRDDRLRDLIESSVSDAARAQGFASSRAVRSRGVNQGSISRVLTAPKDGTGIAVQNAPGLQMVTLSWDDRQLLLAMDVRFYRHNGSDRMPIRETGRRLVRYVGPQSPAGTDPVAYWSAQDGARFLAQVELGLQRLQPLVWDETLEPAKASRKDTTSLQIGQSTQSFPGRLWKQEGGYAYLHNKDGGITVVATDPAAP